MKTVLPTEISTVGQAKMFLTGLHSNRETYHLEDDATDLEGQPFGLLEGAKLNELSKQIFNLPEVIAGEFDPFDFLLSLDPEYVRE